MCKFIPIKFRSEPNFGTTHFHKNYVVKSNFLFTSETKCEATSSAKRLFVSTLCRQFK